MEKEKQTDLLDETEAEINEIIEAGKEDDQRIKVAGKIVDGVKDTAEKGAEFVGDAAKAAVDFADVQLKQAKDVFDKLGRDYDEARQKRNIEKYRPIFEEDLETGKIEYPNMINIVDFDKRMGIEECKGAIGFKENIKNVELIGIYKNDLAKYEGIEFYPDVSASVYYVHPFQNNKYIEVFEYFKYLKEAKVAELENIAQKLGAKHFSVKIMEESMSNEKVARKGGAGIGVQKDKGSVDTESDSAEKKYEYVGIAAENTYPGKEPEEPELVFWANNESIKSLVKQRMDKSNPITSKKFTLDYNTSSGIKEKDAAKIDGVLKTLKFKAAGSIQKEAQKESKRRFEYTIDF